MTQQALTRADLRFFHRLRVRWVEVDMQKIVFNAHYLMYLDNAMGDYWRALALPYESAMALLGGELYLKQANVDYCASAHYDEMLEVGLRCKHIGNSSVRFAGGIFRGDTVLIAASLVYVFADAQTQRSKPVPQTLRALMQDHDAAGAPLVQREVSSWSVLGDPSSALRQQVFVQEQGVDAGLVWDDDDALALHALVRNRLGQPLAAGRLVQHAPGVGRIGRMAVHAGLRGQSLGRDVLRALLHAAWQRGDREVMLHAQCSAEGFYRREGFVPRGPVFVEAGIPHIEMTLQAPLA